MNNIVLIGMPSCGKSTVGVLLAKRLGFQFIDTDLLLQQKTGKLLHEIIAAEGLDRFLALENELCAGLQATDTVIATGGSVVYGKEAMQHLADVAHIVYLKISYETLTARLGDYVNRGVVLREGMTLYDLYLERTALYEKYADVTVDEGTCAEGLGETLEKALFLCQNLLT
ncbi:MAG: shikimate kinase [Clostridia bacterium]|nr:shikimate kinase [Clostridia bacterium]